MGFTVKVVHKVYLGFAVIVAMLIASSLMSDGKLAQISASTLQVNDSAIPVFKLSNQLQIALLKQAKLSALSFNNDTLDQVKQSQQNFAQGNQVFDSIYEKLLRLVGNSAQVKQDLLAAKDSYQTYDQAVAKIHHSVSQRIQLSQELNQTHQAIELAVDQAGALLIDLADLEYSDSYADKTLTKNETDLLSVIAGKSNQIDGHLFRFLEGAQEIVFLTDLSKAQIRKKEQVFILRDISVQIQYLKLQTEGVDDNGLMAQFLLEYQALSDLLIGDNSLVEIKLAQLNQIENAHAQLAVAQTNVDIASGYLDALLTATDKQFAQLQQHVLSQVSAGQEQLRLTLLIVTICAIIAGFISTRAMIIPLKGINRVLKYMAHGDLSRKLHVKSADEFGQLSTNINSVVSETTSLVEKIVQDSTSLSANLTTAAENSAQEISEMSGFIEQQRHKVGEVEQIAEHIHQSTHQVAEQANTAVAEMLLAQTHSQQVDNIAQINNQRITDLAITLDQTTENIDNLQAESTLIGGIIDTIRSIAEQTNLLALNAAIEAARAGEHGRGFAVVADEVRSLAARTQQATAEIQVMINTLRERTSSAVSHIGEGKQQVMECVKYTDELTQSLSVISLAINHIHGMNSEIASAAQQQQVQSDHIKNKVSDVLTLAEKSGEKSQLTLAHSKQIASLADELNGSVHSFTV
jgi:methyl-accepting chemotaxis protein